MAHINGVDFSAGVREREEAKRAGGFFRFLHDLPFSHTHVSLSHLECLSEDELAVLCNAIAPPPPPPLYKTIAYRRCTLRHLGIVSFPDVKSNHICDAIAHNTSIESLEVTFLDWWDLELATMLPTNISLRRLSICSFSIIPIHFVKQILIALQKNCHLQKLELYSTAKHQEWPSSSFIVDSLRNHGILSELHLGDYGKTAAIRAQLQRNKENQDRIALLKSLIGADNVQVQPTTARLFLCGLPFSGKTTLCKSLIHWSTDAQSSLTPFKQVSSFMKNVPQRTRTQGIEVSTMEIGDITVSLWDLAGQEEFYALHDHMFPNFSSEGTPSMFLFVWNPIEVDLSTGVVKKDDHGKPVKKSLMMFESEFKYWLKFISSKTLKSIDFRPRVLVAITRADLLHTNIKSWLKSIFIQCMIDFNEWVALAMEDIFHVDARSRGDAKGLAFHILDTTRVLLGMMPPIYKAFDNARKMLNYLVQKKESIARVITKDDFFRVCRKYLGIDQEEMQDAIALYLNSTGDLIYFKSFELVVMDTEWFCHRLMGKLLLFDGNGNDRQGFFSVEYLECLLESQMNVKAKRFLLAKSRKMPKIEGELLVKLLMGLSLACRQDDSDEGSNIFIPTSLRPKLGTQVNMSYYLKGGEMGVKTFIGRRLKCKDAIHTFFTPGIFPLLQITLKHIFRGIEVTLHENVIALSRDGVNVLIEFCKHEGQDQFIDILVHSQQDLDGTIRWVYEEIIDNVERVCAEPRGIQGVELVHEVIRPSYVKDFIELAEERRNAAVPVEDLKSTLRNYLEKRGLQPDWLDNVLHTWQTTRGSDRVVDLLGYVETLKMVELYKRHFLVDLQDVLQVSDNTEACSTSCGPEQRGFSSTLSGKERKWIYDKVQEVQKDVQGLKIDIENMRGDIQKLCRSLLPELRQKLQELLVFSKDGEEGRLPRLFVVTRNMDKIRRLVCVMVPGLENVRLELLCEHRRAPHLVPGQRGLSFATLEDGLLKRGLPYINFFLKLAVVAAKVGAHVGAGLGDAVPDFSGVLGLLDTPRLPSISNAHTSRMNFQDAQQWLHNMLSEHACLTSTNIREKFGLSRVRYHNGCVGWLCDEHGSEGVLAPV